jgi:pimeloyl-ACP methyl ester carboxylesterase
MTAVAFNASGSGIRERDGAFVEPHRFRRNTYGRELADLGIVVGWALKRMARTVDEPLPAGLIGHSRGGTLCLLHAASDSRIGCVATLGAQSQLGIWEPEQIAAWDRGDDVSIYDYRTRTQLTVGPELWNDFKGNRGRYDVARAVESLGVPLLIAHGDRDRVVAPEHARRIAAHAAAATTELRIIEGAGHTFQAGDKIRRTPPQLLDMVEVVTAWMRRWLQKG